MRESDQGRLVQVVNDLAEQPVPRQHDIAKGPALQQWFNHLVEIVLSCLQRQVHGRMCGVKSGRLGHQRPVQIQQAAGQAV